MFTLLLVAIPVLSISALASAARHAARAKQAPAEAEALEEFAAAQITQQGQLYRIVVNIDAPITIEFPLALTLSDNKGLIQHFTAAYEGRVTEEALN
jgi:hypothetical protein